MSIPLSSVRFSVMAVGVGIIPATLGADWWLEAGPAYRGGMQFDVRGSSYVQQRNLHAAPAPLTAPSAVGDAASYADRDYDDGYVRIDSGTLNPESVGGPGNTWNWTYDNAAQYDGEGQTLSFHSQGAPGYTTLQNRSAAQTGNADALGIQLRAGVPLKTSGKWSFDLGFSLQGMWGADSRMKMTTYRERVSQLNVTDMYDVSETVHPTFGFPPPRTAPGGYIGTYDGPAGGPSAWPGGYPIIFNLPTSRGTAESDVSFARNRIDFRFESDFYELAIAPRVRFAATKALSLHVTPNIGIGYVDISARRTETFIQNTPGAGATTLASWRDSEDSNGVRFASGITAGADVQLGRGIHAGIFGGYDWVVSPMRFSVGPNRVELDSSGFVAGVVIGKTF